MRRPERIRAVVRQRATRPWPDVAAGAIARTDRPASGPEAIWTLDVPDGVSRPPIGAGFGMTPGEWSQDQAATLRRGGARPAVVAIGVPLLTSGSRWTLAVTPCPAVDRLATDRTGLVEPARGELGVSWQLVGPIGGLRDRGASGATSPAHRGRLRIIADDAGLPALLSLVERLDAAQRRRVEAIVILDRRPPMAIAPAQVVFAADDLHPGLRRSVATLTLLDDWGVAARIAAPAGWAGCFDGDLPDLLSSEAGQNAATAGDPAGRTERSACVLAGDRRRDASDDRTLVLLTAARRRVWAQRSNTSRAAQPGNVFIEPGLDLGRTRATVCHVHPSGTVLRVARVEHR